MFYGNFTICGGGTRTNSVRKYIHISTLKLIVRTFRELPSAPNCHSGGLTNLYRLNMVITNDLINVYLL